MSPAEVLCFFFISIVIFKAVKDSFAYWNCDRDDYVPSKPARVTAIRDRRYYDAGRRQSA